MVSVNKVRSILRELNDYSDWRFAVGVRIRFANPTLLYQTYPQGWINYYNDKALIFTDPTIRWGLSHVGVCNWDDLRADDEAGMMTQAAEYGLRYGIVVSVGEAASRTLGFFCHGERHLSPDETAFAQEHVQAMHDLTAGIGEVSEDGLVKLRALGAGLRHD